MSDGQTGGLKVQPSAVMIRPAAKADQGMITSLITRARLNPRNLHWSRFLVAEDSGKIVGLRQVRIHKQDTREVASGYVKPEYRRQGISASLMKEILARENGPLYLMCNSKWANYYEQFGFHRIPPSELPPDFGREFRIWRTITFLLFLLAPQKTGLIPMKRNS